MLRRTHSLSFILALASSVWADYYIDDTNITLTYSLTPDATWIPFVGGGQAFKVLLPNGTYQNVDAPSVGNIPSETLFLSDPLSSNDSLHGHLACFQTDSCLVTIPFTGSGITVFVYQAGPIGTNASITIDGAHTQTNVLSAPPTPAYEITNVSMFDIQQLPSGFHTLVLVINNLSVSSDDSAMYGAIMFDYAYVNESLVANSTTTTAATTTSMGTTSASAHDPANSGSHINTGAIIGGVLAIIALVVAGVLAFLWIRRGRGHVQEMIDLHSACATPPFDPTIVQDATPDLVETYDPYTE